MKMAWAFNPFDDNHALQRHGRALAQALGGMAGMEVVYVASPGEPRLATAFEVPIAQRYGAHPARLIEAALRRLRVPNARVTVLARRSPSLTGGVRALADHLSRRGTDLTLLASHARTGIPRLVLGSFAETLVHLAKTDLLVFNERSRVGRAPRALLLAHDLSAAGARGLGAAIRYATAWKCALHVVHVPAPAYGFTFRRRAGEVAAYRRGIQGRVDCIEAAVRRAGLEGSVVIDPRWHPVAGRILRRREAVGADLLLVAARSGRFAGLIGGSVTRALLRTAPVPVLVVKR